MPCFCAIGYVRTDAGSLPRHWSMSDVRGRLEILPEYASGLAGIEPGRQIVVLFHFHQSPDFQPNGLAQTPPHATAPRGVFSTCSPWRPNAIGMSVVTVLQRQGNLVQVQGIDMRDGTPVLDIKPHIAWRGPAEPSAPGGDR